MLSDCKYGYRICNSVIDLNILRSPKYPDDSCNIFSQKQHFEELSSFALRDYRIIDFFEGNKYNPIDKYK